MESLFGLVVVVTPTARGEWKVAKFSKEKEEKSVAGASSLAGLKIEQARKKKLSRRRSEMFLQACFDVCVWTHSGNCVSLHTRESAAWVTKAFLFFAHVRARRE